MKLSELERLAREATPGPWDHFKGFFVSDMLHDIQIADCEVTTDAAFIAAANPQTILRMIEVIKAADLLVKNREHIASVEGTPLWLDVKNLRSALKEMEK